ncbi:MAG TPA: hypothetical protein DCE55_09580 [Planctomycetaceae bacterium]|nr:hypothetical protein [Planctomycetaceae bacterium]
MARNSGPISALADVLKWFASAHSTTPVPNTAFTVTLPDQMQHITTVDHDTYILHRFPSDRKHSAVGSGDQRNRCMKVSWKLWRSCPGDSQKHRRSLLEFPPVDEKPDAGAVASDLPTVQMGKGIGTARFADFENHDGLRSSNTGKKQATGGDRQAKHSKQGFPRLNEQRYANTDCGSHRRALH